MTELKWSLLQDILDKKRSIKDVVEILKVSRQSVSKWLSQYRYDGINEIMPKKP
jgi:transposase